MDIESLFATVRLHDRSTEWLWEKNVRCISEHLLMTMSMHKQQGRPIAQRWLY